MNVGCAYIFKRKNICFQLPVWNYLVIFRQIIHVYLLFKKAICFLVSMNLKSSL